MSFGHSLSGGAVGVLRRSGAPGGQRNGPTRRFSMNKCKRKDGVLCVRARGPHCSKLLKFGAINLNDIREFGSFCDFLCGLAA